MTTLTANDLRNVFVHDFDYIDEERDDVERYRDLLIDVDGDLHHFDVFDREFHFWGSVEEATLYSVSENVDVRNPASAALRLRALRS